MPPLYAPARLPTHTLRLDTSPRNLFYYTRSPFRSAGRILLVRCQQVADPLRVGGHRGFRLCWLCLGLGSGVLPAAALAAATALAAAATALAAAATALAAA